MSRSLSFFPFAKHQYRGCVAAVARDGEHDCPKTAQRPPQRKTPTRTDEFDERIWNATQTRRRFMRPPLPPRRLTKTGGNAELRKREGKILLKKWAKNAVVRRVGLLATVGGDVTADFRISKTSCKGIRTYWDFTKGTRGCLGNLLLLSYRVYRRTAGRNIQAIGVVNTVFLLSQLFFTGNCGT